MLNPSALPSPSPGWTSLIFSTSKSNMLRMMLRNRRWRQLRSGHDLATRIRSEDRRLHRGPPLCRRRAVSTAKLDAAAIVPEVADADEECAATAILDHARVKLRAVVGAQMDRTADHAQREIVVDGKRSRPRAAATPRGQTVLADRAPALRFVGEGRGAHHDDRHARSRLDPVRELAAALELDHELDLTLRVRQHDVPPLAARQPRVDGAAAAPIPPRAPR